MRAMLSGDISCLFIYLFIYFLALSNRRRSKLRIYIRYALVMLRKSKEIKQTTHTRFKLLNRPTVAEIDRSGNITLLDNLQQNVTIFSYCYPIGKQNCHF